MKYLALIIACGVLLTQGGCVDKSSDSGVVVLNGLSGPVTVNGSTYDSVMPPMSQLTDDEVANILTLVANSWGNTSPGVTKEQVRVTRMNTKRPALC